MPDHQPVSLERIERGVGMLATETTPDRVYGVMAGLSEIGEPAVAPLLAVIVDTGCPSIQRQRAVGMFPSFIEDARAVQPIISVLRDADVQVRWAAVKALEDMREESAIPELEYVATHDNGEFFLMPNWRLSVGEDAAKAVKEIRSGSEPQWKRIQKVRAEIRQKIQADLKGEPPAV